MYFRILRKWDHIVCIFVCVVSFAQKDAYMIHHLLLLLFFLFLNNIPLCAYPKIGKIFEHFTKAYILVVDKYVKKMLNVVIQENANSRQSELKLHTF